MPRMRGQCLDKGARKEDHRHRRRGRHQAARPSPWRETARPRYCTTSSAILVKLQEAENQIGVDYEVYDRRPNDADLLIPAIEVHQARLGRVPYLVAADATFYSAKFMSELGVASPPPLVLQFGGFVGTVFVDDIVFDHASRWFQGPMALVLKDVQPMPFQPAKGMLGVFRARY